MLKVPRFMKEYANSEIRHYKEKTLMADKYKDLAIERIKAAVNDYSSGLITLSEAMNIIAYPF